LKEEDQVLVAAELVKTGAPGHLKTIGTPTHRGKITHQNHVASWLALP
jgi:hypothetical protein